MADKSYHVEVVAADTELYSGEATFLIAQTTVGELGILAGHEPLLGQLVPGGFVVIVETSGERKAAAIEGGFLSVTGESVTILADSAEWADDVDVAAEKAALEAAEPGSEAYNHAHARLTAAEHLVK
ncbi:F0F1 ATP synthase subunit epsilon [Gordonia desulfuricans]|uniref:ATP synthase epsilon chain n=1 Tax=Gordonia desulfuricans TaxID=89051 RepID=A0A7K3LQ78_9ACTN|nr:MULTISPECIES: F0F1 ATP synthase subunit epsilon [Gordonia]EMP11476.1 ATP synthase F0F1 subunit epsilon [Gordonia sp. NB41Y]NDK90350.1 F0F1 ATP synthase subunit epsilon [Gordonia desulfuricans]WLP91412.1 F0F1 ATP synthase subunit epsilon [Gordonia sp. NB41Y]